MDTNSYGNVDTNTITPEMKALFEGASDAQVDLADKRLVRIIRLRLVTDRDFPLWDLSYCYGRLADGSVARVRLPQWQFSKTALQRDLVEMCKSAGRYGKGLGIFDPEVLSKNYG